MSHSSEDIKRKGQLAQKLAHIKESPSINLVVECHKKKKVGPPELTVQPNHHAFANVVLGTNTTQVFVLSNTGESQLAIQAAQWHANPNNVFAIAVDPTPCNLNPGQTANLSVRFTPQAAQQVNGTLRIPSNDPRDLNGYRDVPITGTGRQLAVVTIAQVTFANNHAILNDQANTPFATPEWVLNRNPQSPVCYTRNATVRVSIQLNVTTHPSQNDTLNIRGRATFGNTQLEWAENNVAVNANANTVDVDDLDSNAQLPNVVAAYANLTITWEYQTNGGQWTAAGTSVHQIYATLANPILANRLYLTLLHHACTAAAGVNADANVITTVAGIFANCPGIVRIRDNVRMGYWTNANAGANTTDEAMVRQDGSLACGAWAELLIDMWKVLGVDGGIKVNLQSYHRFQTPNGCPISMLVANAPGQHNNAPPRGFANHFIVRDPINNRYYDPSYGTGPFQDVAAWKVSLSHTFLNQNNLATFTTDVTFTHNQAHSYYIFQNTTVALPANATLSSVAQGLDLTITAISAVNFSANATLNNQAANANQQHALAANDTITMPQNCIATFPNGVADATVTQGLPAASIPQNTTLTVRANGTVSLSNPASLNFNGNSPLFRIQFFNANTFQAIEDG